MIEHKLIDRHGALCVRTTVRGIVAANVWNTESPILADPVTHEELRALLEINKEQLIRVVGKSIVDCEQ